MMPYRLALLAAGAALGLAACAPEPGRPGTPGVPLTSSAQPVQQGVGTSQEDRYVTQRGGSSAPMQGGRITGVSGGGAGPSVTREGSGTGVVNPRITGIQQEGSGNMTIQRDGVGAPPPGSGATRREQQRRQQQQPAGQPAAQ